MISALILTGLLYDLAGTGRGTIVPNPEAISVTTDPDHNSSGAPKYSVHDLVGNWRPESVSEGDSSFLKGAYAVSSTGGAMWQERSQVVTSIGLWTFDGRGGLTIDRIARATISGLDRRTLIGSYAVNTDATVTFTFADGRTLDGIVTEHGAGFVFSNIRMNSGFPEAGFGRKVE